MAKGFEVKVAKLEGSPLGGRFVRVFEQDPSEEELRETRGKLFGILELSVDQGQDAEAAGRLILDTLTEEYLSPSEESPLQALERAVYEVRGKLRDFSPTASLDLSVFTSVGEAAYFGRVGRSALYLRRGPEAKELLPGEEQVAVGSQVLANDDAVVLGSAGFARNFTPQNLPDTEFLVEKFEKGEEVPGLSAFLLRFKGSEEEKPVAEEVVETGEKKTKQLARSLARVSSLFTTSLASRLTRGRELASKRGLPQISLSSRIPHLTLPRLILILAVFLLVSVGFTIWRQAGRVKAEEFERFLTEASQSLEEAQGLVDLSNEQARELINSAQADLASAARLYPKSPRIDPLRSLATELYYAIEKITPVTEEHAVYDLTLQVDGAQGRSLAGAGETLFAVEASGKVFQLTFGEAPLAQELSFSGGREAMTEGETLYLRGDDLTRYVVSSQAADNPVSFDRYDKVAAVATYLGNIYFLVPEEDQVYKFIFTPNGYSKAKGWLEEAVSLSSAVDMAIDGEVWVLTREGEVLRFEKGARVPFLLTNLSTPFQEPRKIFTQPNFKHVYVLDQTSTGGRVVIFNKSGEFIRQFKGEVLSDLKDLWVSGNEKTLYLLSGSRIYRVGL